MYVWFKNILCGFISLFFHETRHFVSNSQSLLDEIKCVTSSLSAFRTVRTFHWLYRQNHSRFSCALSSDLKLTFAMHTWKTPKLQRWNRNKSPALWNLNILSPQAPPPHPLLPSESIRPCLWWTRIEWPDRPETLLLLRKVRKKHKFVIYLLQNSSQCATSC